MDDSQHLEAVAGTIPRLNAPVGIEIDVFGCSDNRLVKYSHCQIVRSPKLHYSIIIHHNKSRGSFWPSLVSINDLLTQLSYLLNKLVVG